jgi:type IV secretion system protein VirB10
MRVTTLISVALLVASSAAAQGDRNFSGSWVLDAGRSDIRSVWVVPGGFLRVDQTAAALTLSAAPRDSGPFTDVLYPLNGSSQKSPVGVCVLSVATRWEGDALLVNLIVSGSDNYSAMGANYSAMERWERSRDGSRLTITRTIQRKDGESESVLIYTNPAVPVLTRRAAPNSLNPAAAAPQGDQVVVAAGTRILLRLTNAVNTKHSAAGDKIYLQTAMPVFVNGRLAIPQGSYVVGSITESERAGRVKGKSGLNFRFETLTLPNGVSRDFLSRAGSVDTAGSLDRKEGRITGESGKGSDAKTVAGTTAAGTGIGTIAGAAAGNYGMGMGIGAAAGAAAGLAKVFGSRGPDVTIPQGTTMELVLDRDLTFTPEELRRSVR